MKQPVGILLLISYLAAAKGARADVDGVYRRFDGDLDIAPSAGAQLSTNSPSALVSLRAIYLGTVGAYATYTDAMRSDGASNRTLSVGTSFRPLFLPRWGLDLERGPAWLDLAIDATAFELGALWGAEQSASWSRFPGFEAAVLTEFPLLGRASGPWLGVRGALRWGADELHGRSKADLAPTLAVMLSWHLLLASHVVDYGDRTLR